MRAKYVDCWNFCFKRVKVQLFRYRNVISILPELEVGWDSKHNYKVPYKVAISFEWLMFGVCIHISKRVKLYERD